MPRIDPLQLLKCLSVLLKPNGGIKSKDEVQRLASLMTKFSKKLVSKCIYVSILKATETDLLIMFMSAGGWDLIYTWLSDGVIAKNWPLVNQLLDLLHVCPVDIERLKTNACPKLIKTLSKDYAAEENVRLLACKLVEQWLKIVRGEIEPVSVGVQPVKEEVNGEIIALNDVKWVNDSAGAKPTSLNSTKNIESEELPLVNVEDTRNESNPSENQLPVYKITIRDGKKLLAEVFSADRALVRSSGESTSTDPDIDEEESDDDIKPVKVSKKNYANKVKVNVKRPVQLKSDVSSRDSVDSNSSSTSNKSFRSREDRKQSGKRSRSISPNRKSKIKSSANRDKQNIIKGRDKNSGKMSFNDKKNSDKSDKDKNIKIKSEKELQEEREFKESLSKIITPSISKLGKIPKKINNTNKDEDDPKKESSKVSSSDIKKPIDYKKVPDIKKPEKKYSMSIGVKRSIDNDAKPKTVKTFNSKFRSTGLEETPPPPPKPVAKKPTIMPPPTIPEKKPNKRLSLSPDPQIPEKKTKSEHLIEEKKTDKIGGIKLIPAKPKPMFLEESDVFMNALTAANLKEPRKRKRRTSASKDGVPENKKETNAGTPPSSPLETDEKSPPIAKPFKFYQDTLETSIESEETKVNPEPEENLEFLPPDEQDEVNSSENASQLSEEKRPYVRSEVYDQFGALVKGALVHFKSRRGPKKSVRWREGKDLEDIRHFEMDETERVNVTKNFTDMKQMERINERENFQMARKIAGEDIMEEKTRWQELIPCEFSGATVIPGKNSIEKDVQYAREKTVAPAFYFNKRAIPDSPAEPDLEIHATTDPAIIPLEDITGHADSVNDFTAVAWPEPKVQVEVPPKPEPITQHSIMPPVFSPSGFTPTPFPQGPPGFMHPAVSQLPPNDWRNNDNKMQPLTEMFPPQPMMGPMGPMMPQPMMAPHGPPEMGFPMNMPGPGLMEDMGHFGHPFSMGPNMGPNMGPSGMISPPYQPQGPGPMQGPIPGPLPPPQDFTGNNNDRFRNDDHSGGGRGMWFSGNGPFQQNRGGQGGGFWRGGIDRRRDNRDRDRDSNKSWGCNNRGFCNMYMKRGFCKNNKCQFKHSMRN